MRCASSQSRTLIPETERKNEQMTGLSSRAGKLRVLNTKKGPELLYTTAPAFLIISLFCCRFVILPILFQRIFHCPVCTDVHEHCYCKNDSCDSHSVASFLCLRPGERVCLSTELCAVRRFSLFVVCIISPDLIKVKLYILMFIISKTIHKEFRAAAQAAGQQSAGYIFW